jgi:hypothetical protein
MANPTDLQGMLTSQLLQPQAQEAIPSTYEQRMLQHGQRSATGLRRAIGAMTGADTRTTAEKAQAMMANLDINEVEDQEKILQLVNSINPAQAPKLVAAFAQQKRERDAKQSGIDAKNTSRAKFAEYLDKTYPNKGYGALALQGLITPANMKNFIKEADKDRKTQVVSVSVNGVNKQQLVDSSSGVKIMEWDSEITGTSNPNEAKYFTEDVVRNNQVIKVMFKREGDQVSEVSTIGTTKLPDTADLEQVEVTKADGQTYVHFLDLSKPEGKRLVHEQKVSENRITTESVDPLTGQKSKYTTLPDGTERIPFGIVELPKYKIEVQDNGTYNVFNETLGIMEQEGVATKASAQQLIAKKQKTQETLTDIDRQIGFVNEAKTLTESYQLTDAVIFHPLMKFVPGSDAKYLQKLTETLQSRIARDTLMELREGSAVGATGLGALNLKELELLQNALGNLDPTVGDARFRKQLNLVKKHYQGFRASLMGRPTEIDWSNPAYREFTRTITNAQGKPETYYTLSDETGSPLVDSNGKPLWFRAITPVKKD